MCRLFGFRSAVVSRAHRSLVEAENALSQQARNHPDGWGIGYFHGSDAFVLKSEEGAADHEGFRRASSLLSSNTFVVHVRRATVGGLGPFNVHPFRHGRWLFAHNGTIFGFDKLRERMLARIPASLRARIFGSTDTEHLFFWFLAALEAAGIDPAGHGVRAADRVGEALTGALDALYEETIRADVPAPIVNFILTNGDVFVANRSGRELYFASQKKFCGDAESCPAEKICLRATRETDRVNHLLVASERIGEEDRWEELEDGRMILLSEDFRVAVREPPPRWRPADHPAACPS